VSVTGQLIPMLSNWLSHNVCCFDLYGPMVHGCLFLAASLLREGCSGASTPVGAKFPSFLSLQVAGAAVDATWG